ncbi:MAG: tRNA (adenosine(37)-N6)-threonylcarbamoyltransferase complex transferase subunit TsaD, partial [Helicobacter sp.]|nr:tRNA (adenosine(37)-N6)-threonylcarbamoyltransferase complex transferase subunit TsaD [Helicobacter sp.]
MSGLILSIESSCDDSSIAITDIETKKIIFHQKVSQEKNHSPYG